MRKLDKNRLLQGFSPFVIFGVAIILVPIFVLMTMDNIREQNDRTIEKLTGKGIFLIRAFEAGTRAGMLTMSWSVARVQNLLTETALQPEVAYMMITDKDGIILAHSDHQRVGERYENMPDIKSLDSDTGKFKLDSNRGSRDTLFWHREIDYEDEKKEFQVFKQFTPAHRGIRVGGRFMRQFCMAQDCIDRPAKDSEPLKPNDQNNPPDNELEPPHCPSIKDIDWFRVHFIPPKHGNITAAHQNQIIFAALDMSEVEVAKAKYLRHVVAMGFMFFVLGCTGVVGIVALQGYRSARTSISELKSEIERSRRLAAVGKLAAGVAHEIRNPLSSIKGFATYFKERYSTVKDDMEVAQIMIQEVERLNRAVTQLLEFAKPLPVVAKEVNLKELIAHSVKLIEYDKSQKAIEVQVDYQLNRENIVTDPDRLNQILLNLYLNAVQALDNSGRLTIRVFESDFQEKIAISVKDTGKGIDEKDMEHIFDPYFTTRPDGTGLGLAMVHRAVEALGGSISVESQKGRGSTFFLTIPL
ncbi:MAG: hypothetical protein HQK64_13695 [Desulfamplus sp.]|nr:hypothetical protein [Desulfamplus sp.]